MDIASLQILQILPLQTLFSPIYRLRIFEIGMAISIIGLSKVHTLYFCIFRDYVVQCTRLIAFYDLQPLYSRSKFVALFVGLGRLPVADMVPPT